MWEVSQIFEAFSKDWRIGPRTGLEAHPVAPQVLERSGWRPFSNAKKACWVAQNSILAFGTELRYRLLILKKQKSLYIELRRMLNGIALFSSTAALANIARVIVWVLHSIGPSKRGLQPRQLPLWQGREMINKLSQRHDVRPELRLAHGIGPFLASHGAAVRRVPGSFEVVCRIILWNHVICMHCCRCVEQLHPDTRKPQMTICHDQQAKTWRNVASDRFL